VLGLKLRLELVEIRLNTFLVKRPFEQVHYIPIYDVSVLNDSVIILFIF